MILPFVESGSSMKIFSILFVVGMLIPLSAIAQTYDLQFVETQNNGSIYEVKLQIKANGSEFNMGSGNLVFTYNTSAITSPTLHSVDNFSGTFYSPMTLTQPATGRVSVNIELLLPNFGTTVPLTYVDIITVRFNIVNLSSSTGLVWRTISPNATNVFKDDNTTVISAGTLHNLDEPLPIQLANLSATYTSGSQVRVEWMTLSETNNYGFEVQKAAGQPEDYQTIPNSFVPGHGTTVEPHAYEFVDNAASLGTWFYRLKQIDLDGSVHYTDGVQVDILSGVDDLSPLPTVFGLGQNYPNPFNPSTTIEFAVPKEARVRLEVYNLLGERVAILLDDVRTAGYHKVQFDASNLSTGLYFYRLSSGDEVFLRKMTLVK